MTEKFKPLLSGFNPSDIFDELQSSDFDPSIFEKIDERDIIKAPNFITWSVDPSFLNTTILPKQIEVGAKLNGDYCPRCSNPGYIDTLFDQSIGNIRDNIVFLEHGLCPKCKVNRFELYQNKDLQFHNELALCQGQRSGKSKLIGLLATYSAHRFLKIPNPLRYFHQPSGELLMGTFSALTAEQARDTLWEPFKGFIDASPWFQNYHSFLKTEGKKLGQELYSDKSTFLSYLHKRIVYHYTGSQDRKMRGKTRIFGSIDELGWFISDETKKDLQNMSADGVYTALSNSLSTMRMKWNQVFSNKDYDAPPVFMLNASSPSSAKDKIMRLLQDAQKNPKILAIHAATWQCVTDDCLIVSNEGVRRPSNINGSIDGYAVDKLITEDSKIINITLEKGGQFKCTPNHLIETFIEDDGPTFKPFSVDSYVTVDFSKRNFHGKLPKINIAERRNSLFEGKKLPRFEVNKSFYFLTGLYLAEDTLYNIKEKYKTQHKIVWYNTNIEIVDIIIDNIRDVWGLEPNIIEHRPKNKTRKICYRVDANNAHLIDTLLQNGFDTSRLSNKKIPEFIFSSPIEYIGEFICGFLEGGGSITDGDNGEIAFWSTSKKLCTGLRQLLLICGIPSTIYTVEAKGKASKKYSTRITGKRAIQRFSGLVTLKTTKNVNKLNNLLTRKQFKDFYYDSLHGPFLNFFWKTIDVTTIGFRNRGVARSKRIGKSILKRIYESQSIRNPIIEKYLYNDLYFEKVLKLDDAPNETVYDFSIHNSEHTYWSDGLISHNCNPDYTYETLREEFAHIEENVFMRDFGAEPPLASDPFISDSSYIDKIATEFSWSNISVEYTRGEDPMGGKFKSAKLHILKSDRVVPRLIALDLGYRKNALALVMFSITSDAKIKLDLIVNVQPEKGVQVNIVDFFDNVTLPLVQNFNIKHAFFDRWQSIDQVQRLRNLKVSAEIYSLRYRDMEAVRGTIISQGVRITKLSTTVREIVKSYLENDKTWASNPINILVMQFLTVRDTGNRMAKPIDGDDDIFRAFALGVNRLSDDIIRKVYTEAPKLVNGGQAVRALGSVYNKSKGNNNSGATINVGMGSNLKHLGAIRTKHKQY